MEADLKGRKTNHTARKTSVETLCRAQFQDSEVMQFTGHRSVASLNSYKKHARSNRGECRRFLARTTAREE